MVWRGDHIANAAAITMYAKPARTAGESAPLDCNGAVPDPVGLGFPSAPVGVTMTTAVLVASGEPGMVWTLVVREGLLPWSLPPGVLVVLAVVVGAVVEDDRDQLPLALGEETDGDEAEGEEMLALVTDTAAELEDAADEEEAVVVMVLLLKTRLSVMAVAAAAAPAALKARATNRLE